MTFEDRPDPGALNVPLILEEAVDVPDGAGGAARSWTAVQTFMAQLHPLRAQGGVTHASKEQRLTHEVVYRAGPALTADRRLRRDTRIFRIDATQDLTSDRQWKRAFVEETQP